MNWKSILAATLTTLIFLLLLIYFELNSSLWLSGLVFVLSFLLWEKILDRSLTSS